MVETKRSSLPRQSEDTRSPELDSSQESRQSLLPPLSFDDGSFPRPPSEPDAEPDHHSIAEHSDSDEDDHDSIAEAKAKNAYDASQTKSYRTSMVQKASAAWEFTRQPKQWPLIREPDWPQQPQELPSPLAKETAVPIIFDVLLALMPISFIVLGAMGAYFHGKEVCSDYDYYDCDRSGDRVAVFTQKWGVTIFPVFFAAVCARALRMIALWSAERGTKLGTIEQLLGSTSVASAVTTQFQFRHFSISSLGLIVLWSLSPLGGQASLRLMDIGLRTVSTPTFTRYMDTEQNSIFAIESVTVQNVSAVNKLFTTVLEANEASLHTFDFWGNTRIPILESLNVSNVIHGWIPVPIESMGGVAYAYNSAEVDDETYSDPAYEEGEYEEEDSGADGYLRYNATDADDTFDPAYSSLVGVPSAAASDLYNGSFTMNSSYFLFDCPTVYNATSSTKVTNDNATGEWIGYEATNGNLSVSISTDTPFSAKRRDDPKITPRRILFQSTDGSGNYSVANCTMTQSYVESLVACNETGKTPSISCAVIAMRSAEPPDNRPVALTPFENFTTSMNFFKAFASASVQTDMVPLFVPDNYDLNVNIAVGDGVENDWDIYDDAKNNDTVPTTLDYINAVRYWPVSIRAIHTLFNTYWLGSLSPDYIENPNKLLSYAQILDNDTSNYPIGPKAQTSGPETVSTYLTQTFVCHIPWLLLLLLSSSVLLFISVVGVVMKYRTHSPDILGYMSSHTRDNPYIRTPSNASTLKGIDRTRLLFDTRVRLQDVQEGDEVGHIALASYDGPRRSNLIHGRVYV